MAIGKEVGNNRIVSIVSQGGAEIQGGAGRTVGGAGTRVLS